MGIADSVPVVVSELLALAQAVLNERAGLSSNLGQDGAAALLDILRVGTSAGGGA